jgi:methyl-accepting chemotaxis protein
MLSGLINSINPQGNFMGGTAIGGMMNLVGEQGPEFIMPNANSLVATAKQFADKARPQMEQMAASMGPQMEQMASQMRPQMEDMAQQMRSQFGQGTQNGQSVEALVARLETGFTSLVKEMQNNNREVRKLTGNAYRV